MNAPICVRVYVECNDCIEENMDTRNKNRLLGEKLGWKYSYNDEQILDVIDPWGYRLDHEPIFSVVWGDCANMRWRIKDLDRDREFACELATLLDIVRIGIHNAIIIDCNWFALLDASPAQQFDAACVACGVMNE